MNTPQLSGTVRLLAELVGAVVLTLLVLVAITAPAWAC